MQTADNGGVETISALENHGKESCDNAEMAVIEAGRKQLDIACASCRGNPLLLHGRTREEASSAEKV